MLHIVLAKRTVNRKTYVATRVDLSAFMQIERQNPGLIVMSGKMQRCSAKLCATQTEPEISQRKCNTFPSKVCCMHYYGPNLWR